MRETMIVLALAATLKACAPVCTTMQTRCNGPYVEICDFQGQWQRLMRCEDLTNDAEPWGCCQSSGKEDAGPDRTNELLSRASQEAISRLDHHALDLKHGGRE